MSSRDIRAISLQAFYSGSHRQFIDSWIANSRLQWQQITLPGRHWKWRMRHAAIEFAGQLDRRWMSGERWDVVLCTDMLNVAEFKGLLRTEAKHLPTVVYFHENQFEYPNRTDQPRDLHFAFTNLTTVLAADAVWFNSEFNLKSFIRGIEESLSRWPDYPPRDAVGQIKDKARVVYPGISIAEGLLPIEKTDSRLLHIVWAARWEHDKNPDLLLQILNSLDGQIEFSLSVIGQRFENRPAAFDQIAERFRDRIVNWGYQQDRQEYVSVLQQADLFLSTAAHEFFGLSAVEAIAAGCVPVLPNDLAYPELLRVSEIPDRKCFLFETVEQAVQKIVACSRNEFEYADLDDLAVEFRERFDWLVRAGAMDEQIEAMFNPIDKGMASDSDGSTASVRTRSFDG